MLLWGMPIETTWDKLLTMAPGKIYCNSLSMVLLVALQVQRLLKLLLGTS